MIYVAYCVVILGFCGPAIYFFIDSACFYSPANTFIKVVLNFRGMSLSAFCAIP